MQHLNTLKHFLLILISITIVKTLSINSAYAWGTTGHKIINKKASMHLPSEMSNFKADSLFYELHASDADFRKDYSDTSFYAEHIRHYIDIDIYPDFLNLPHSLDSVISLYGYENVKQIGVLPWATVMVLDSLTAQLSRGDASSAKLTASDLGHYVGDGHQPLHCTVNYDGQLTNNHGIHSRHESSMLSYYSTSISINPDEIQYITSPIDYIFDYINRSQSYVDSIMLADNYAKFISGWNGSGSAPESYYAALWEKTESLTKDEFQRGTVALASLWYTAWVNAGFNGITISPIALNFGWVPLYSSPVDSVVFTNDSQDSLRIFSAISANSQFIVSPSSAVIAPNSLRKFYITFTPTSTGLISTNIIFTHNMAGSPADVQAAGTGVAYGGGIFFSEYFEGLSFNKAIEIYNGNLYGVPINLNRLRIRLYSNGAAVPTNTTQLSLAENGTTDFLPWGSTFVIYHSSFSDPNTNLPNTNTATRVALSTPTNYNGDDAIELQYDVTGSGAWVTVDVFGEIGVRPAPAWGSGNTITLDNGILRKSTINTGRASASFDPSVEFQGRSDTADFNLPVNTLGFHICENPLPVQLGSFVGNFTSTNNILLEWQTISEINNLGFYVERKAESEEQFVTVSELIPGAGYSLEPRDYSWTDTDATGTTIEYRLKQVDYDGLEHYYGPITVTTSPASVKDNEIPAVFKMDQNYPNPFNPATMINYQLPLNSYVTIKVYNILGNEVATLADGYKNAGYHKVTFDGANLSSGIYFYKIQAGKYNDMKKMLLVK